MVSYPLNKTVNNRHFYGFVKVGVRLSVAQNFNKSGKESQNLRKRFIDCRVQVLAPGQRAIAEITGRKHAFHMKLS